MIHAFLPQDAFMLYQQLLCDILIHQFLFFLKFTYSLQGCFYIFFSFQKILYTKSIHREQTTKYIILHGKNEFIKNIFFLKKNKTKEQQKVREPTQPPKQKHPNHFSNKHPDPPPRKKEKKEINFISQFWAYVHTFKKCTYMNKKIYNYLCTCIQHVIHTHISTYIQGIKCMEIFIKRKTYFQLQLVFYQLQIFQMSLSVIGPNFYVFVKINSSGTIIAIFFLFDVLLLMQKLINLVYYSSIQ
eukprot:TRINITY_DN8434_c0_g1_i1.p1 TRINITY_DN8434_c0_g1~~TRINITY_DN8434_c0_g1_i1.p1  ORF type:complete len:243 (-),score=-6.92 TRINITY_DN8434_c0_g1_i1:19-747(-)